MFRDDPDVVIAGTLAARAKDGLNEPKMWHEFNCQTLSHDESD